MEVKLWTGSKQNVIYVRQVTDHDCIVAIEFVDEIGNRVAEIFSVTHGLHTWCQDALEKAGYDTSFANWDDSGRYLGLKGGNGL